MERGVRQAGVANWETTFVFAVTHERGNDSPPFDSAIGFDFCLEWLDIVPKHGNEGDGRKNTEASL
ncbi:MAG TPA: hypothetical protein VIN40_06290 [Candidatus Tyrphobacter sp.]